jgi:DNA-binding XRE family transcriptional regulator
MPKAWQWDVRRSDDEIRQILKNPEHPNFLHYASLLLSRTNVPKEVFGEYVDKQDFCIQWPNIKRRMRKDQWSQGRIQFWQEIYRHLKEDFKAKGILLRHPASLPAPGSLRVRVGKRVREIRRSKKMTQAEMADGAGLTQQFVSKIEQGTENVSLDTLERIQKFLKEEVIS